MTMLASIQASKDPFFNLATEDFLLHERSEDFLILSVNDPSVIIGKHQVAQMEVSEKNTSRDHVPVLRRISGGGTVYHDHGNLNFAFIRQSEKGRQVDFSLYTQPVIEYLADVGIRAVFEGKNDLTLNGLKISGNAEHVFRERVLHHGTLLFDASLGRMKKYLKPVSMSYSTRGVLSNRSSVVNLKGKIRGIETIGELMESMMTFFKSFMPGIEQFSLSEEETQRIIKLSESKYKSWEWTWGYGPEYVFEKEIIITGLRHKCRFLVKDGIIWESDIKGSPEMERTAKSFIGCRHMFPDILSLLQKYGLGITEDEAYEFF